MPCGITALWSDVITTGVGGNPQRNHNSTKDISDGSNAGMIHHNLRSMGAWSNIAFTLLADPIQVIVGWSHGTIWGLRLDEQIGVHNIGRWLKKKVIGTLFPKSEHREFDSHHGPPRLWPWASHFTLIASSFEWDIKPRFLVPECLCQGKQKLPQGDTGSFMDFPFIMDVQHMSIGHTWKYSYILYTIFCQMAALELWVLLISGEPWHTGNKRSRHKKWQTAWGPISLQDLSLGENYFIVWLSDPPTSQCMLADFPKKKFIRAPHRIRYWKNK
jgi:hypothetical protein